MMALPAMVLEAEAAVSTASAGARTLTSGDAGTSRSAGEYHICRHPLPRSRSGLRQMIIVGSAPHEGSAETFARGSECD